LLLVGVYMLIRAGETLQTVLGLVMVLSAVGVAVAARSVDT
jgi:hypothetical protein